MYTHHSLSRSHSLMPCRKCVDTFIIRMIAFAVEDFQNIIQKYVWCRRVGRVCVCVCVCRVRGK